VPETDFSRAALASALDRLKLDVATWPITTDIAAQFNVCLFDVRWK